MIGDTASHTDRRSAAVAVAALVAWVVSGAALLVMFDQMSPIALYCLSYLGFLLVAQWTFSKEPGTRLRRALVLTVVVASLWFLLAIGLRILELLPEIDKYV